MKYCYLPIILPIVVLLLIGCSNDDLLEGTPFVVEQCAVIPDGGRASAVAFAIGDKGYVALGRNSNGTYLNDCWQYSPGSDTWTQKADFPGKVRVKAVAATVDGIAYAGLGYSPNANGYVDTTAYLKDFWMYDAGQDQWTRRADFPTRFTSACAAFVYDHALYVGSGFGWAPGATIPSTSPYIWKYTPTENTWTRMPLFPGNQRLAPVGCAGDDHCYFGTGFQMFSYNDWWEYTPSTGKWAQKQSLPGHGRENAVAFTLNNRYIVATGRYFRGNTYPNQYLRSDLLEYDPQTNKWISRGNLAEGRENAVVFTINGKGYIGFGENDTGLVNNFWCVHP
ncbi:MAG: Kelch repeat type 1-containing protein [Bacteroidetes bacterium]|nr:Kelch repeat type 1-containing protein [Bacteroidota bacterium]